MTDVRPFRFAVQGGPFTELAALQEHARQVEGLGYEELYSYDHVGAVDPFVPLVVAALATTTLRVGPLVINNEFHNTALLARTAATVATLTGHRLVLGMGSGYMESEHQAIDLPIRPPGPRVTRFAESLAALRQLLDTGAARLDGEHVRLDVESLGVPAEAEAVPFLIGAHGPRMVRLAADYADIFQFTGLVHGEGGVPSGAGFALSHIVDRAQLLTDVAGDRNSHIERSALVQFTSVGDDAPPSSDLSERFQLPAEVIDDTPFVLSGTQSAVVDKLERLRDLTGISHIVVRDHTGFAPIVSALTGR